ncbi:MAG: adenylosuccinate synthetase, partial [Patescibacteria group bacterium]
FAYHKDVDGVMEERRSKKSGGKIGTTRRGIGPAYVEKAARTGMRLGDMQSMARSAEALRSDLLWRKDMAAQTYGVDVDVEEEANNLMEAAKVIGNGIRPVSFLHDLLAEGKSVLIEGAQASLLDIDHGTYPYVTSSQTTSAGALQGLGLPPRALTSCIGVAKAYCTRVGEGAFLTEAQGPTAGRLRERGGEYGATTGRPRRCGWLSLPDLRRSARLNGFTHWNLTKLDVLDEEETIPVCTAEKGGKALYEEFPGWNSATTGMTIFDALPQNAREYIRFIEESIGIPVALIGTGPGRGQMIVR